MSVYDRIKETAKTRGMSLQAVAEKSGLSPNMIYQYKKVNPKLDTSKKIAKTLGVSVDYLLGNNELTVDDVSITHKLRTEGLNEEQLQKVDDYIEFLKYEYLKDVQKYDQ